MVHRRTAPTCAPLSGGPPTRDDLDTAAAIAQYAGFLGTLVEQYEPVGWAEELIEPAKAVEHPRLAALYSRGLPVLLGRRIDDGIRYSESGQRLIGNARFVGVPFGYEANPRSSIHHVGQPERWADMARRQLELVDDGQEHVRASLAMALTLPGRRMRRLPSRTASLPRLNPAATRIRSRRRFSPSGWPSLHRSSRAHWRLSGERWRSPKPAATNSTNRTSRLCCPQLETLHGAPEAAFDYITLAIRNYLDTGNIGTSRSPLAILAALLDRLGHYEPAATIADFAANPVSRMAFPEITTTIAHLRRGARRRALRIARADRPGDDQRGDGDLRLRADRLGSRAAQFSDNADLSTSSGRPPRSRARRWNSFNDSPRPSISSRSPCQIRCPTAYDGAWPGQPR